MNKIPVVSPHSPHRILLVEDDPEVLRILARCLRQVGYVVETATDGAAGLARFQTDTWDLVIADRAMPIMDGEVMAREIKARSAHTPLILITGLPLAVQETQLFTAVLTKPFRTQDFLRCTADTLASGTLASTGHVSS